MNQGGLGLNALSMASSRVSSAVDIWGQTLQEKGREGSRKREGIVLRWSPASARSLGALQRAWREEGGLALYTPGGSVLSGTSWVAEGQGGHTLQADGSCWGSFLEERSQYPQKLADRYTSQERDLGGWQKHPLLGLSRDIQRLFTLPGRAYSSLILFI